MADINQLLQRAQNELQSRNAVVAPEVAAPLTQPNQLLQRAQAELQSRGAFIAPEGLKPKENKIANFLAGSNEEIAKTIALPTDIANEALDLIGLGMVKPGDFAKLNKQIFRDAGVLVDPIDNWEAKLGKNSVDAILTFGALYRGAAAIAEKPGVSATKFLAKEISDFISKQPFLAITMDQAASAGGVAAHELYGKPKTPIQKILGPVGEVAGAVIGGSVGAGLARRATGLTKATARAGESIAKGIKNIFIAPSEEAATKIKEPLLDLNFNLTNTGLKQYSENQLDASLKTVDDAIDNAIKAVPLKGSPEQLQTTFRNRLDSTKKIARRIESDYWHRVDMKRPVPMSGIRRDVAEMANELENKPSVLPKDFMDKLTGLSMPIRGPTGKIQKALPSIERLRDLRSEIRHARLTEQAKDAPYDGLIASYNRLEGIIDNGIAEAYPKDVTLQQARAMSIKLHDMFDRNNLGALFARRRSGQFYILPEQAIERLLPRFKGLSDITDTARKMVYLKRPSGKGFAATQDERNEIQLLRKDAEDAIRAMFRDQAERLGPEKAAKWFVTNEKRIRPLSEAYANLDFASRKVIVSLENKAMLEKSALAKFIQYDPDLAIKRIFNDPKDPVRASHEMLRIINNDPEAAAAYGKGLIKQFFTQANFDPQRAKEMFDTPRFRTMMQEALSSKAFKRFSNVIHYSYTLTKGESHALLQKMSPILMISARIFGAQSGHIVARFSGGGTVQTPGILADAAKRYMARILKTTDPDALLANAIVDPQWETILRKRMFSNKYEMQKNVGYMLRILGTIEGERQGIINRLSGENKNDNR